MSAAILLVPVLALSLTVSQADEKKIDKGTVLPESKRPVPLVPRAASVLFEVSAKGDVREPGGAVWRTDADVAAGVRKAFVRALREARVNALPKPLVVRADGKASCERVLFLTRTGAEAGFNNLQARVRREKGEGWLPLLVAPKLPPDVLSVVVRPGPKVTIVSGKREVAVARLDDLADELGKERGRTDVVYVALDGALPWADAVRVLDACRAARLEYIVLVPAEKR